MELLLPPDIVQQFVAALQKGGRREVGGILMGEHIGPETFRVEQITVQLRGGTFASFVRLVDGIIGPLKNFFVAKRHNYVRFNYIGEWHSHHSFELNPSGQDHRTMHEMADDPQLGAHFVALLLVRLSDGEDLEASVTVYRPGAIRFNGEVVLPLSQVIP